MTARTDKPVRNALLRYQHAMSPLVHGALEMWQWKSVCASVLVTCLLVWSGSWLLAWLALCLGFIVINFMPAQKPLRFVRFLAHKSPLKPIVHVKGVTPGGVIELDYCGSPRVVVECKELNTILRKLATTYGAPVDFVLTTGIPRTQWHERPGWPKARCFIMGHVEKDILVVDCAEKLLQSVRSVGLEPLQNPDRTLFDATAGHGCYAAHYFVELMPFDLPTAFIDELMTLPVDYTIVLTMRTEGDAFNTRYIVSLDIQIFAPSKLELTFYARNLEAIAKAHWIKLRSLRWRKPPFSAAFQDVPLGHELTYEIHPTDGPTLVIEKH